MAPMTRVAALATKVAIDKAALMLVDHDALMTSNGSTNIACKQAATHVQS